MSGREGRLVVLVVLVVLVWSRAPDRLGQIWCVPAASALPVEPQWSEPRMERVVLAGISVNKVLFGESNLVEAGSYPSLAGHGGDGWQGPMRLLPLSGVGKQDFVSASVEIFVSPSSVVLCPCLDDGEEKMKQQFIGSVRDQEEFQGQDPNSSIPTRVLLSAVEKSRSSEVQAGLPLFGPDILRSKVKLFPDFSFHDGAAEDDPENELHVANILCHLQHLHQHFEDLPDLYMISICGYANFAFFHLVEIIDSGYWSILHDAQSLECLTWKNLISVNRWSQVSINVTTMHYYYVHTQESFVKGRPIDPHEHSDCGCVFNFFKIHESDNCAIAVAMLCLDMLWNNLGCVNCVNQVYQIVISLLHISVHTRQRRICGNTIGSIKPEDIQYLDIISGSESQSYEHDLIASSRCTKLSLLVGRHVEDTVSLLFGMFHQKWTTTLLSLILRFNGGDILNLSSVMVKQNLQLSSAQPRVHAPDRLLGEPPAGHQLVWSTLEAPEDCRCSNIESVLSTDERSLLGSIYNLRFHPHVFRPLFSVFVHVCTHVHYPPLWCFVMCYFAL